MTCMFVVQDRAFTPDGYCVDGYLFDTQRGERSVPLTKESGIVCFKNSDGPSVANH